MQKSIATSDARQTACRMGQTTDALSRFLSNELRPRDAEALRAHLQMCATCQTAYEEMRLVQAGLRALPNPSAPYGGSDAARERVFARLERSVRVGDTAPTMQSNPRRAARPWFVMTGLASAAAACAVLGLAFWPAPPQSIPVPAPNAGATSAPLPGPSEMAFLYQLHDAQHGETANGFFADPADRRDSAAEARANLLRNTESLADNEAL